MMALSGFHDKLIEASYKHDPHSQVLLKHITKLRRFWYDAKSTCVYKLFKLLLLF